MPMVTHFNYVLFLLIYAAIVVGITALISWLIGGRLEALKRAVPVVVCGAILPVAVWILAEVLLAISPRGLTPNGGPAGFHVAITTLAALAAPVSFATSAIMLGRKSSNSG